MRLRIYKEFIMKQFKEVQIKVKAESKKATKDFSNDHVSFTFTGLEMLIDSSSSRFQQLLTFNKAL